MHGMARWPPRGNHVWGAGLAAPQAQGEHMDAGSGQCVAGGCGASGGWSAGLDGRAQSRSIRALLLPAAARLIDRRGVELSIDPRRR